MDNAEKMTQTIIGSVKGCGVRAIVSEGWSKLGKGVEPDPDILFIGDCPHGNYNLIQNKFTAFAKLCRMAVQACRCRDPPWRSRNHRMRATQWASNSYRPILWRVSNFFIEVYLQLTDYSQPFWVNMVAAAGAGPRPIDHKSLNVASLSKAIAVCIAPETQIAAQKIAEKMKVENGVRAAVRSFHRNLPIQELNCDMVPKHPSNWSWKKGKRTLKLSHRAASILVEHKKIEASSLKLYDFPAYTLT